MGSPIVNNLGNTFRYLPQHVIEGLLGPKWGPKVEGFVGMSPAPVEGAAGPEVYQAPGSPDPNYQREMLDRANKSFVKPDVTTMRKPLPKGK